jgi:hypothetical protein
MTTDEAPDLIRGGGTMKTSTLLGAGTLLILLWLFPFYYIGGLDAPFPNVWASSFAPLLVPPTIRC